MGHERQAQKVRIARRPPRCRRDLRPRRWSKLVGLEGTAAYIASKGLPAAQAGALLAALLEFGGGLAIALGIGTRWASLALAIFLVPTTVLFHNPTGLDGAAAQMQMIQVYKNLAIAGGLLLVCAY